MSMEVAAVVGLKTLALAKSRFADLAAPLRRRLAWLMAVDTLQALTDSVDHVLVVTDQPAAQVAFRRRGLDVEVVPEAGTAGLNQALSTGANLLSARGARIVLASVGDLPAVKATSIRRVVAAGRSFERSFLSDASGIGTTMLIANEHPLDPRFSGRSSAAHHASGAQRLGDHLLGGPVADARRDVDNEVDLYDAFFLGLGAATSTLVDATTRRVGEYLTGTVAGPTEQGWELIATTGYRLDLPAGKVDPELLDLHPGQRLQLCLGGNGRILSAWL